MNSTTEYYEASHELHHTSDRLCSALTESGVLEADPHLASCVEAVKAALRKQKLAKVKVQNS